MIGRRCVCLALAGTAAGAARAKDRLIGFLSLAEDRARDRCAASLLQALAAQGWAEGASLRVAFAFAARDESQLAPRARELVALRPEVLIAAGLHPVWALHAATREIPIVALGTGFLRGAGLIQSVRKPGKNVTGVSLGDSEHAIKLLDVLSQLLPSVRRVGVVSNRNNPAHAGPPRGVGQLAAQRGIELAFSEFSRLDEIEAAWRRLAAAGVQAVMVRPDLGIYLEEHVRQSSARRLPAIALHHRFAHMGGSFAYGSTVDFCPRGARYVAAILQGQSPATLPVEEIWDVGLVVNLRSTRQLGVVPAPEAVARAVEVIE